MKKFLYTCLLLVALGAAASAQVQNKAFENDTVKGDTVIFESGKLIDRYNQSIVFQFNTTDIADSLQVARLEGSNDGTNWIVYSGGATSATSTDGPKALYVANAIYLYHRVFMAASAGDTVAITDPRFIIKKY